MTDVNRLQRGDEIRHPRKPEWGRGIVRNAESITFQGARAQRVTVDFANHGRAVINTAVVGLVPAGKDLDAIMSTSSASTSSGGWLAELEQKVNGPTHELWDLPDAVNDPFLSDQARLQATLETFRFSTDARSLIDWAVIQTGLDDPMTRYTRQELEQAFPRYARNREQHLKELVQTLKRQGQLAAVKKAMQTSRIPAAKQAIQKALRF